MAKKKGSKAKSTAKSNRPIKEDGGQADDKDNDPVSFEQALAEVEQIVRKLESGDTDLTESMSVYELGIKRLKQCYQFLEQAERHVTLLSGFDSEGNPITTEFETNETESLETKQKERSQRRSGGQLKPRNRAPKGSDDDSRVEEPPGLF